MMFEIRRDLVKLNSLKLTILMIYKINEQKKI